MKLRRSFADNVRNGIVNLHTSGVVALIDKYVKDVKSYDDLPEDLTRVMSRDDFKRLFYTESECEVEGFIDKVLNISCEKLTCFMIYLGIWDENTAIADYGVDEIGSMVTAANRDGYDVELGIEMGRDEYIYGRVVEKPDGCRKVYRITGLIDTAEEFMSILNLRKHAEDIILNNVMYNSHTKDEIVAYLNSLY